MALMRLTLKSTDTECSKEWQCLLLFATEMVFIQKAVSDIHWKITLLENIDQMKTAFVT